LHTLKFSKMFPKQSFLVILCFSLCFISCQMDTDVLVSSELMDDDPVIGENNSIARNDSVAERDSIAQLDSILVFSKTVGFRHSSISKGIETLRILGDDNGFAVIDSEDEAQFNSENLKKFALVVFLNTTGDVLNSGQEEAFQDYIRSGGSFMGIHSASDTEYDWPWYGQLLGAYFNGHPDIQEATLDVRDNSHSSSEHLSAQWTRSDEWYNFKSISPSIKVILSLDESSYQRGTNGDNHPIAWYQEFEGGRSFYTGGGHTDVAYDEPDFIQHLLGGIKYCLGR